MSAHTSAVNILPSHLRRRRFFPLWLLGASLLIPTAGVLFWSQRGPFLAEYHFRLLSLALDQKDAGRAAPHVTALMATDQGRGFLLDRARSWELERRQWLAQKVLLLSPNTLTGFTGLSGTRIPTALPRNFSLAEKPLLEAALELDPDNHLALGLAAEQAVLDGNAVRGERFARRIVETNEESGSRVGPAEYIRLARCLMAQDRWQEAEACLNRIRKNHGAYQRTHIYALSLLSQCLERQGKYVAAIRIASDRIGMADDYELAGLLAMRGRLFGLLGRSDLAIMDFSNAISRAQVEFEEIQLRLAKARTLGEMQAVEQALAEFDWLLSKRPAHAFLLAERARMLSDAGRYRQAIASYREAITSNDQQPSFYNNLAWLLITASDKTCRDPAEALRLAKRAVELDGERQACFLDTLAEAYYVNGHFRKAVETERQAIAREGELFRSSLQRFTRAMEQAARGLRPEITDSPLKDHHRPVAGDCGAAIDIASLPRIPRLTSRQCLEHLFRPNAPEPRDISVWGQESALFWTTTAPPVADSPSLALGEIIEAMYQACRSSLRPEHEISFMAGLFAGGAPDRDRAARWALPALRIAPETDSQVDGLHQMYGLKVGRFLARLKDDEAGNLLLHLAKGSLRLRDCYFRTPTPPAVDAEQPAKERLQNTLSELAKRWQEIEANLQQRALTPPAGK